MQTELIAWLLAPASGSSTHDVAPWLSWHGRLMVLGWGVAIPVGALLARFFKVLPRQNWPHNLDNQYWWHAHRGFQYSGVLLMSLGAWLAWGNSAGVSAAAQIHGWCGWTLVFLGWLQVAGGLWRGSKGGPTDNHGLRGDHYDMTPRRLQFERLHKLVGYIALLGSVVAIQLGLFLSDAPRWMWLGIWMWWVTYLVIFVVLQRQGRCMNTYQAIWGTDLKHPGNQLGHWGWGMKTHRLTTGLSTGDKTSKETI